ncbi:uncharacterized protein CG13380 [Nematostella vectensis]|uniref:uncharacterized protein CG13380 n=1 Tax=Nematostella vectensis TaxID=45351 RepID=UPI00138FA5D4|nr:uncharacterized protein CG13380 [Nematostella vectensis]
MTMNIEQDFITYYFEKAESSELTLPFLQDVNGNPHGELECKCLRKAGVIRCLQCGHEFTGRRRIQCPLHPNLIHLMDFRECPRCNAELS